MNLTVASARYMGLLSSILLIQSYALIEIDIDPNKVDSPYNKVSSLVADFSYFRNCLNFWTSNNDGSSEKR